MRRPSDFSVEHNADEFIVIRDLNLGNSSVTNDAEGVCRLIYNRCGNKRIFYYDSEGDFAELQHNLGEFIGFANASEDDVLVS